MFNFGERAQKRQILLTINCKDYLAFRIKLRNEMFGSVQSNKATMINNGYAIAQAFSLFHRVGYQKNGFSMGTNITNHIPDYSTCLRVQTCSQLIQKNDLWI